MNSIYLIISGIGNNFSQSFASSGMNYYFTASPPQADLNALGIVTKKQAYARYFIRLTDIDLTPRLMGGPLLVFLLRCFMREFVAAGGELIIHGAANLRNSQTHELPKQSPCRQIIR